MKRLHLKLTIVALLFLTMACDKYLDLEPYQSISETRSLENDANVKNALTGAYTVFDNPELYGGCVLRNAELLGGNGEILWVGTYGGPRQIFNKELLASNEDARAQWVSTYSVINICNNVLSALDKVKEEDRDVVEGEALFLRGLMYFDLARFYALPYEAGGGNTQLGVPIVLEPTRGVSATNMQARNSVEEVYTQVIADLTRAATILPAENDVRASGLAATALLARVYLQMGRFSDARDAANTVIGSNVFELQASYADVFDQDDNTSEDIFATQITSQDRFSAMTEYFSIPAYGGRDGDIDILNGHLNLYSVGDERYDLFFMGNGAMRSGKWNNMYGVVNLIRLAEMYLIRAECNIRIDPTGVSFVGASAVDDYNVIHERAGLTAVGSVTLNDILLERRLELAHEGFKIHDMKRLHSSLVVGAATLQYNDPKLVFPIPAREMEANPNLEQNVGYE